MKIIRRDLRHGKVVVAPETLDDLWVLYNTILPEDEVHARTTREVKVQEEAARPTKGRRIPVSLTLRVKEVALDRTVNRLRVRGVVTEAPEDLGIRGSYHTINLTLGKPLTIIKERWLKPHLERLREASRYRAVPIVVVALDDEDCGIAVLRHYGFDVKTEMKANLAGKLEVERRIESKLGYYKAVAGGLLQAGKAEGGPVVIVGPGFIKNEFANYLNERYPKLAKRVVAVRSVSSGGLGGVYEALRVSVLSGVAKRLRAAEETRRVDEIFIRLGRGGGNVTYGTDDVERAAIYGSVGSLLVSIKLLREAGDDERRRLEEIIRVVERMRGRVTVISDEHEAGKKLLGLGGVAALLRFRVD
ncbi:MAG: mRNA surveillance protein pelota [Candidatus Bathyarchaeia archaeon]